MAKVDGTDFSVLVDGQILKAEDLISDRVLLKAAIDDNQVQISTLALGVDSSFVFSTKSEMEDKKNIITEYTYVIVLTDESQSGEISLYRKLVDTIVLEITPFSLISIMQSVGDNVQTKTIISVDEPVEQAALGLWIKPKI